MVNASMAMSCVAEAMTKIVTRIQNSRPTVSGINANPTATTIMVSTAAAIHLRYVPKVSTSGDQKTFSVQASPTVLSDPMAVSAT